MFLLASLTGCGDREQEEPLPDIPVGVNLIENPSFEEWEGRVPVGWKIRHFEGEGKETNLYGRSTKERGSGDAAFFLRGIFNTDRWMVLVQRQPVIPGYRLSFSAAMKNTNLKINKGQEQRAHMYIQFLDRDGDRLSDRYLGDASTHPRVGTSLWGRDGKKVDIPTKARFVEVGLINQMTGYLYFDDVELVLEEPLLWIERETQYITFHYMEERPLPDDAIAEETAMVKEFVKKLNIDVDEKIKYYFYPSETELQKFFGVKRGHERALWSKKELHTTEPTEDHIVIHLLLADKGYPPFGLAEGIVFYLLNNWEGRDLHAVAKDHLVQKRIPALYKALTQKDMYEKDALVTIPAWASFSKYLIDKYGIDKFMKLYVATNEVEELETFNVHFKDVYGDDFPVIDRQWRLFVLRYQPATEGDTLP